MKIKGRGKILVFIFIAIAIILAILSFHIIYAPTSNIQEELSNSADIINKDINNDNEISENDAITAALFSNYYDEAASLLEKMTLDEKVSQMFLARYPESQNIAISEIAQYTPGGYILFARDFKNETKNSIKDELKNCQDNSKINLFFGVDEEGGTVVRVSSYKNFRNYPFESPRDIYSKSGISGIISDSNEKTELLKSLGINMNLTPVVDIPSSSSDFIYKRAVSTNLDEVVNYTENIIKTMKEDNIISVMKHFPGYGNNVDTHTGISIDKRDISTFENTDFIPFEKGIELGAPVILVNHNIVECMDKDNPASLSKNVHDILRNELNFSGIIITDDLAMDAIYKYADNGDAATKAVLAGNDMIISSDFEKQRNEVISAVHNGTISEDLINTAVKRILACKYAYGIIE